MDIIVDEHITLELTAQKHAQSLFDAIDNNRVHLSEFLPWVGSMQTVENAKIYIETCETLYEQKKEVSFVIIADNKLVGRIGLHHLNLPNKIGAIGYWLAKDVEGKGIITKACKALINFGFNKIELNRIEIKAAVNNFKSQAIPVKLNFTKEGILREAELVNNTFIDLFIFSMLKKEWIL